MFFLISFSVILQNVGPKQIHLNTNQLSDQLLDHLSVQFLDQLLDQFESTGNEVMRRKGMERKLDTIFLPIISYLLGIPACSSCFNSMKQEEFLSASLNSTVIFLHIQGDEVSSNIVNSLKKKIDFEVVKGNMYVLIASHYLI